MHIRAVFFSIISSLDMHLPYELFYRNMQQYSIFVYSCSANFVKCMSILLASATFFKLYLNIVSIELHKSTHLLSLSQLNFL